MSAKQRQMALITLNVLIALVEACNKKTTHSLLHGIDFSAPVKVKRLHILFLSQILQYFSW